MHNDFVKRKFLGASMSGIEARLSARPLYMQVRDLLVHRIVEGGWKPGASLPNETILAQQFGISIGTVRKALDIMEDEHIVTRRQGRGTFVNDFSNQPNIFTSFYASDGKSIAREIVSKSVQRLSADREAALRLHLSIGDEILEVKRVRINYKKPFLTETCILPARLFRVLPEDFPSYRLSVLAQQNGIIVGHAEESVTTAGASPADANDLGVSEGTSLLALDRVIYSNREEPLEWRSGRCFLRHERFVVKYQ